MFCKNCGKEIDDKAAVCIHCGVAVKESSNVSNEWLTMLLLCLFVGWLGVHNFYVGKTKEGIVELLCCTAGCFLVFPVFIGAVLVIIDLVNIITKKFKRADGSVIA